LNQSINQSIDRSIDPLIDPSIDQSVYLHKHKSETRVLRAKRTRLDLEHLQSLSKMFMNKLHTRSF